MRYNEEEASVKCAIEEERSEDQVLEIAELVEMPEFKIPELKRSEFEIPEFKMPVIDLDRLKVLSSFDPCISNPDLTDKYANKVLRDYYGSSQSFNASAIESASITRSFFAMFRDQELRYEMLSKQHELQRPDVVIPSQSGNDEFDQAHQAEQAFARNGR